MTNQNPAASQTQSPHRDPAQEQLRQRAILAKVNAHADRSMDRLFADIEELLSSDLEIKPPSTAERVNQTTPYSTESSPAEPQYRSTYPPQSDFVPSPPAVELDSPPANKSDRAARIPLWLQILLGLSIASIAAGSLLLWLINERKIVLPNNIDTSWLPFQSQSQVSPADVKFANYMRKSLSKIEAATQATSATNLPNPANNVAATTPATQAIPIATNPTVVTVTAAPTPVNTPISLVKTLKTGNRSSAIFQIDGNSRTVNVGQKIGTTNWSLLSVAKSEIVIKRTGGEIRSIAVGQKF
jgi:hypothetical protein